MSSTSAKPRLGRFARSSRWFVAISLASAGLTAVTTSSADATDPATPATLVVTDAAIGTGAAGTADLQAVTLKTFNSDGSSPLADVSVPSTGSGALTLSGNTDANGALTLSSDNKYLLFAGYNQGPGPSGVVGVDPKDTTAAQIHRIVGRVDKNGTVDTSTNLGDSTLSASHPRNVTSADGQTLYVAGNGGADTPASGLIKVDLGGGNLSRVSLLPNLRYAQIAGGDMYVTSDKAPLKGFARLSTGLPTSSSTAAAPAGAVSGTPTAVVLLDVPGGFAGIDTAYVINDTKTISKFTSSDGSIWAAAGAPVNGNYQALTAKVDGTKVDLYAVKDGSTGPNAGNSLVAFQDSTPSAAPTYSAASTVATAAAGHAFRGVSFAPTGWALTKPQNVQAAPAGAGKATVTWNAVPDADSYVVSLKEGGNTLTKTVTAPTATATFKNLDPSKTYTATVIAKETGTPDSAESDGATVQPGAVTSLDAPANLAAEGKVNSAKITWDAVDNATTYHVVVHPQTGGGADVTDDVAASDTPSSTVPGLDPAITYDVSLTAGDGTHTSPAATTTVTPQAPALDKPTNVQAAPGVLSATITWDPVVGATSYVVLLKDGPGDLLPQTHEVQVLSPTPTSTVFTGLDSSKTYIATVQAKNQFGLSPASDDATVTPNPVPGTTTTITAARNTSYGDPVAITVAVANSVTPANVPAGAVTVTIGSHNYPGLLNGSGEATVNVNSGDLAPGTLTIKATYAGLAGSFKTSNSTKTINVARASTAVETHVFNPVALVSTKTSTVTIHVGLTSAAATTAGVVHAGGTVQFFDGASSTTVVATGTLNSAGNVTLTLPKFKKATHTFTINYVGTKSLFNSSKVSFSQVVK